MIQVLVVCLPFRAGVQLYSPSRGIRPQDLPSLAEEAIQNIKGYGNLVVPSLVDIEDMLSDTGAVVQKARYVHKSDLASFISLSTGNEAIPADFV